MLACFNIIACVGTPDEESRYFAIEAFHHDGETDIYGAPCNGSCDEIR